MRLDKFTIKAQEAFQAAQYAIDRLKQIVTQQSLNRHPATQSLLENIDIV